MSQRAGFSFGGYAKQQLVRLSNALARDHSSQEEMERHILSSCERAMQSFCDRYQHVTVDELRLYIAESARKDRSTEIVADISLRGYPIRDLVGMINELNHIARRYNSINTRNKKGEGKLGKHMMHLIRLYYTGTDILEKGEIIAYRDKEHDLLMDIRNGKYLTEDGKVVSEFKDILQDAEEKFQHAKEHTHLPPDPDLKKINRLVMTINEASCQND